MKKNAYTLVELMATIAILGIVLVIAIPKINDVMVDRKKQTFLANSKAIIRQIEYNGDEFTEKYLSGFDLGNMSTDSFDVETSKAYIIDDIIYLNLVGKGSYNGMYLCGVSKSTKDVDVQYSACSNAKYVVTFDPDGGTVETNTKEVLYHAPYGELPIPTRDGYTFKGWNGKNVFIDSDIINSSKWRGNQNVTVSKENGYVQVIYNQNTSTPGYIYRYSNNFFNHNKNYTISFSVKGIGTKKLSLDVYGAVFNWSNISNDNFQRLSSTFNLSSEIRNYLLFYESVYIATNPIGTGFQIKDLMVEEGTTASEYEPYFITSKTRVAQANNHTLKAIWEPNS